MLVTVLLFVLGLVLLIAGSELLVRGASRLAAALGVSCQVPHDGWFLPRSGFPQPTILQTQPLNPKFDG